MILIFQQLPKAKQFIYKEENNRLLSIDKGKIFKKRKLIWKNYSDTKLPTLRHLW